ncbi:hypothetical protein D7X25_24995 [bacterium 1XD42-8]|nr:hypothetical protein D7X25_24995 [bacterium 1XD42-8]
MADELSTWEKGLVRAKKSLEEFQEKIGSLTGTLDSAASSFSEFGNMITSSITDPTTKAGKVLSELSFAQGLDSMAGMNNARAILTGLGYDAESVKEQMNGVLESMKGMGGGGDIGALVAGIGVSFSTLGEGISTAGPLLEGLNGISSSVVESITNIPDSVKNMGDKMKEGAQILGNAKDAIALPFQDLALKLRTPISAALGGVTTSFGQLGPALASKFPAVTNAVSTLSANVTGAFSSWGGSIGTALGGVGTALGGVGTQLSTYGTIIGDAFAPILERAIGFIPTLLGYMNVAAVAGVVLAGLGLLYGEFGTQIDEMLLLIQTKGPELITNFCSGIANALPELIAQGALLVNNLMTAITANIPAIISGGMNIVTSLISGVASQLPMLMPTAVDMLLTLVTSLFENMGQLVDAGLNLITGFVQGLLNALPKIIDAAPKMIGGLITAIVSNLPKILETGIKLISELAIGLIQAIPKLVAKIPEIIASVREAFTSVDWGALGKNVIEGIVKGLMAAGSALFNAAKSVVSGALDAAKRFLGINSPSKVFRDQVGEMMAVGLGIGFEHNIPVKEMNASLDSAFHKIQTETMEMGTDFFIPWKEVSAEDGMTNGEMTYLQNRTMPSYPMSSKHGKDMSGQNLILQREGMDYDRLIDGLAAAMGKVKIENTTTLDGKTIAKGITPLFDANMGRTRQMKERYA